MKDRLWECPLDGKTRILVARSSAHPVAYAITLVTVHEGRDYAVRTYDNAHAANEHHVHRYIENRKQPPTVTTGGVNEAMARAMADLKANWRDYIRDWKDTLR